jgi:nucleoside-diphosphate-sugar epimerase
MQQHSITRHPIIEEDLVWLTSQLGDALYALEGSSCVITGATGLLGTYLLETVVWANAYLFANPCRVYAVVRRKPLPTGIHAHLLNEPSLNFIECDARQVPPILQEADFLIFAATKGSPRYYLQEPIETMELNGSGLSQWLSFACRVSSKSVLYISSGEIYGIQPSVIPTPENYAGAIDPVHPRSIYAESKRYGEALSLAYWREHTLPVKLVRPFQVFGPGIQPKDGRAFADFLSAAALGQPIVMNSSGLAKRTFLYIADAVFAFWLVLLRGSAGSVYNVGRSDGEISIRALAERIIAVTQSKSPLMIPVDPSANNFGSPVQTCPDIRRIQHELGFQPNFSLDQMILRTYRWFSDIFSKQ